MGEWLELDLPADVRRGERTPENWLAARLGVPVDKLAGMCGEGGIRTAAGRVRLRLFPERDAGFDPWWHPLDVLYEDDFCLVADKPAGLAVHAGRRGGVPLRGHRPAGRGAAHSPA